MQSMSAVFVMLEKRLTGWIVKEGKEKEVGQKHDVLEKWLNTACKHYKKNDIVISLYTLILPEH